ncbi:PASTA domain-containing protein [Actinomadura oligospora]|uniref:PASTA domain-containing protein n=1 Tax=Actinomadura oligospora TaxID=111804 RepID=UPI0004797B6C|nr:PASTA domain-containing protein [Actinomadura oligospora]
MPEGRPQGIPGRTTLLLGGGATAAAGLVLGLTLLVGGGPGGDGPGGPATPVTSAQVGRADGRVTVPPVAGLGAEAATARLAERHLPVGAVIRVPSSRPSGRVVRSYPGDGTALAEGEPVTLYVSAGMGG